MSIKEVKRDPVEDFCESAFKDNSGRFPLDALLRKYNFHIWERKKGEPVWIKNNVLFTQREALQRLPSGEVADAKYAEDLHHQSFS